MQRLYAKSDSFRPARRAAAALGALRTARPARRWSASVSVLLASTLLALALLLFSAGSGANVRAGGPGSFRPSTAAFSGLQASQGPLDARQAPTTAAATPTPGPPGTAAATSASAPALSESSLALAFVNSAETNSGAQRIQRGLDAGVTMDRFPIYWERVERRLGEFTWTGQDNAIKANERLGMDTLGILLGTPRHYRSGKAQHSTSLGGSFAQLPPGLAPLASGCNVQEAGGECDIVELSNVVLENVEGGSSDGSEAPFSPQLRALSGGCRRSDGPPAPFGLWNPIFANGTDEPTAGTRISPTNPWARFVGAAVSRYKPGGVAGTNLRHWEVWNEPDLCHFWSGSPQEYARLLKVAYIVIKWEDPQAFVVFGGLAHFANGSWLTEMLDEIKADPLSAQYDGFFDAAGTHHYSLAYVGYQYTRRVRTVLNQRGWWDKPIWVTESGVPVCDDYPGPRCPSPWRARPNEQASYIWQNIAYTRMAGGGPIFHFMLHDDCGNVVAVDSPDGFGLAKNESSSFCSPSNAETRLAYSAFQLANKYLTDTTFAWGDIERYRVRRVAFFHPDSRQRRLLTWAVSRHQQVANIPSTGTGGRIVRMDGTETVVTPTNGIYQVSLTGATNANWPDGSGGYAMGIFGEPIMLIEEDTQAPTASIVELPDYSPSTFTVDWRIRDWGAGVKSASVYVKVDSGGWQLWKEDVSARDAELYRGEAGKRYQFSIEAEDLLGHRLEKGRTLAETVVSTNSIVSGWVINPAGERAAGVTVRIGDRSATTDANGVFSMEVAIGSWNIHVNDQLLIRRREFKASDRLVLLYAPDTNAVTNGDFENDFNGWQKSGSSTSEIESQEDTSDHALRLAREFVPNQGVPGADGSDGGNSTVSQRVSVPAGRPYLAFAYRVESAEPASGGDSFEVIVARDNLPADYLLVQRSGSGWNYRSFDMGAYAGSEVTLIFNVYETSPNRRTSALIDLVTLSHVPGADAAAATPGDDSPPVESTDSRGRTPPEDDAAGMRRVYLPVVKNVGGD